MGQKVNPISLRLGLNRKWDSSWTSKETYPDITYSDLEIKKYLNKFFLNHNIILGNCSILRKASSISIYSFLYDTQSKSDNLNIEKLSSVLEKYTNNRVDIHIFKVSNTLASASFLAKDIVRDLEKRVPFKEVLREVLRNVRRSSTHLGVRGVKISCSGRFGGAAIARKEWIKEGRLPLQTLDSFVDYSSETAFTLHGSFGVKVWIYYEK